MLSSVRTRAKEAQGSLPHPPRLQPPTRTEHTRKPGWKKGMPFYLTDADTRLELVHYLLPFHAPLFYKVTPAAPLLWIARQLMDDLTTRPRNLQASSKIKRVEQWKQEMDCMIAQTACSPRVRENVRYSVMCFMGITRAPHCSSFLLVSLYFVSWLKYLQILLSSPSCQVPKRSDFNWLLTHLLSFPGTLSLAWTSIFILLFLCS